MRTVIAFVFSFGSLACFIYGCCNSDEYSYLIYIGILSFLLFPFPLEQILHLQNKCCFSEDRYRKKIIKRRLEMNDSIGLVYRKRYNIVAPIQDQCHPFDTKKYGRIYNFQKEDYGIVTDSNKKKIWEPDFPSRETQGHDVSFWHFLWMNYSLYVTKIAEVPICFLPGALTRLMLLNPVQYGCQGSIDAAIMAYDKGYAINQSGGYHHCHRSTGSGFCFQPDITQAITHLRKYLGVQKVMIIDLDAHQGNGHERDFQGDQNTYIIDFYNPYIFPGDRYAKGAIDVEFFVTHRIDDNAYISAMQKQIEPCILNFNLNLYSLTLVLIYQRGTLWEIAL